MCEGELVGLEGMSGCQRLAISEWRVYHMSAQWNQNKLKTTKQHKKYGLTKDEECVNDSTANFLAKLVSFTYGPSIRIITNPNSIWYKRRSSDPLSMVWKRMPNKWIKALPILLNVKTKQNSNWYKVQTRSSDHQSLTPVNYDKDSKFLSWLILYLKLHHQLLKEFRILNMFFFVVVEFSTVLIQEN